MEKGKERTKTRKSQENLIKEKEGKGKRNCLVKGMVGRVQYYMGLGSMHYFALHVGRGAIQGWGHWVF